MESERKISALAAFSNYPSGLSFERVTSAPAPRYSLPSTRRETGSSNVLPNRPGSNSARHGSTFRTRPLISRAPYRNRSDEYAAADRGLIAANIFFWLSAALIVAAFYIDAKEPEPTDYRIAVTESLAI